MSLGSSVQTIVLTVEDKQAVKKQIGQASISEHRRASRLQISRCSWVLRRILFRLSCLQKLRDLHYFSAQALISDAEVEFEELTRLPLRDELTPILRFGGLLRLDGRS